MRNPKHKIHLVYGEIFVSQSAWHHIACECEALENEWKNNFISLITILASIAPPPYSRMNGEENNSKIVGGATLDQPAPPPASLLTPKSTNPSSSFFFGLLTWVRDPSSLRGRSPLNPPCTQNYCRTVAGREEVPEETTNSAVAAASTSKNCTFFSTGVAND